MSDPNRATLITVGATKSAKANVIKTVRLTINLDESNESKYPELNYKELVFAEERKHKVQNGKTPGLDPFSDNDDDVERVARKFEQKYGGKSTYSRKKARSKQDDFADIGAGYDENDSFIDNTDGYDEMIPPECDTLYGGFYINSGSLEFKTVPQEQADDEPNNRRNKRRISSSSSEEESSESSSDSESGEEKDSKAVGNGDIDSHKTEHRKKKNKKIDKKKAKKVRRTDSSAATSGKQTSDENNHGDAESADCADSRTSQSDSLTSKPAPSSENAATSDSSRDMEAKSEFKLPAPVSSALDTLEALVARSLLEGAAPATTPTQLLANSEPYLLRLEQALKSSSCSGSTSRAAWARAAACIGVSRGKLLARGKRNKPPADNIRDPPATTAAAITTASTTTTTTTTVSQPTTTATTTTTTVPVNNKRKHAEDDDDYSKLSDEHREAKIVETLQRLKALIDERKPSMLANYNAECERVQEERKKLQIAQAVEGAPHVEKRLPKRRFPWCPRSRALLARLRRLARDPHHAAALLAKRALPLFPNGFVRMPTLLRQAEVKEIKVTEVKRQRLGSISQPAVTSVQTTQPTTPALPFAEPIQFPSSLTVTTSLKTFPDKMETDADKFKSNSIFSTLKSNFPIGKDLIVEKDDNKKKEDVYIPPNNIGSITITPVPNQSKEKKNSVVIDKAPCSSTGLIRVKSPAALNDMVNKKDLKPIKKIEKTHSNPKDKRVESPLHIDTSYQPTRKDPSPRDSSYKKDPSPKDLNYKKDTSPKDSNYKKDTSPKDLNCKKDPIPKDSYYKKDVNSRDPHRKDPSPKAKDEIPQKQIESMKITENNIPRPALIPVQHSPTFAKPDKRPPEGKKKKDLILIPEVDPLSDLNEPVNVDDSSSDVEVIEDKQDKSDSVVPSKDNVKVPKVRDGKDEESAEIDTLMKSLREMEHSQEPKFNSNSYSGVITSERTSLNKMDGSKTITG